MSCVLQDFEIAGSRTGALSADCAGGCECDSPLGTVNSWDSHSHYRRRAASPDLSLYSGVIVYCDHTHLKTPTGVIRILLVVSITIINLITLCFASHIDLISQLSMHKLKMLYKQKNNLDAKTKLKLVRTLIYPHIEYCCCVC